LGAIYSLVELINTFKTIRTFGKSLWGVVYVFFNGLLSVIALLLTYSSDIDKKFLGSKIVLAATSALALLRVLSINVKQKGVADQSIPMIKVILNFIIGNYNNDKYKNDFKDIKPLMKDVDYKKAADALPPLCAIVLNTLSEEDGKKMNSEIQKFLKVKQGVNEIKCINLAFILEKHVGYEVLKTTIDNIREHILIDGKKDDDDLDSLIDKYQ
jgi:hypothetical protein